MGNCCSRKKTIKKKIVLLLLGLDNAGKTSAAHGLAGDLADSPIPTVGFSVVNLKYQDYIVKVFDLGGGPHIRGIWQRYFVDAHGIIFVLDSSDFSRFNEAKLVLEEILSNEKIVKKPLLLLANKQDNENALDEVDIIEHLNIEQLVNKQKCPTLVQSCSATENNHKLDPGIQKGYEWLTSYIIRNYNVLNTRVETDSQEQILKDRADLLEKMQRIKQLKETDKKKKSEDIIETYSEYMMQLEDSEIVDEALKIDFEGIEDKTESTDTSSMSFSPIQVRPERPKSALQIVKHQLQNNSPSHRHSLKLKSNKTAPVNLYGTKLSHSAQERRKHFLIEARHLKSADDKVFMKSPKITNGVSHMGPSGDANPREMFQLTNISMKLPPLNVKNNTVPWVHKPMNGDVISVVNID